ncbi:MAG: hypothetical protein STSR0006_07780 [Lentimicrobium sp.]
MKQGKKWLTIILLALGIPSLGGGIYWLLLKGPAREYKLINAVPQNASMVFITKNASQLWEKLKNNNEVWDALKMTETFSKLHQGIVGIDSLLQSQTNVDDFLKNKEVMISFHNNSSGKTNFLLLFPCSTNIEEVALSNLLGNNASKTASTTTELLKYNKINASRIGQQQQVLYYTFRHKIFIASFSAEVLASSLQQINKTKGLDSEPQVQNLLKSAGNNVDATLLLNFDYLPEIFKKWPASDFIPGYSKLRRFAKYASLDIYFQKKKLLLNGYSITRPGDFLRLFRNQHPQAPTALNLIPEHTASFIYLCFDNFDSFIDSYNDYLLSLSTSQKPENQLTISLIQNLKEAKIAEIVSALINTGEETPLDNSLVILRSLNAQHFEEMIKETLPSTESEKSFTINQREFRKIDFERFFGSFLSSILPDFNKVYYYRIDDYFLLATKPQILQDYVIQYVRGKTLINTIGFKAIREISEEKTNFWFYYNPTEAAAFHHFLFATKVAGNLDANLHVVSLFDAISVQVSGEGSMPYLSTIIKHHSANDEILASQTSTNTTSDTLLIHNLNEISTDERLLWKVQLDQPSTKPPIIVNNLAQGKSYVLAFDQIQNTYLFDSEGSLKWKKLIEGSSDDIFCRVEAIRIDNKQVLFFITQTQLYAYETSGKLLAGYPVALDIPLTGPPSLFSNDKKSAVRIYYPGSDSLLHCIDIKGKPIKGWEPPKLNGQVIQTIKRFEFEGKNYFAVPYASGQVLMVQENGKKAKEFEQAFTNSSNSEFYLNETNRKGAILTTDQTGNLVYLSPKGPIEKTVFDNFSKNHFFIYEDFDKNGSHDFIYLDGDQLIVYDRFKNILLQHQFKGFVKEKPLILDLGTSSFLIVNAGPKEGILIFNHKGLISDKPFPAPNFYVAGIFNSKKLKKQPVIVATYNREMVVWRLK